MDKKRFTSLELSKLLQKHTIARNLKFKHNYIWIWNGKNYELQPSNGQTGIPAYDILWLMVDYAKDLFKHGQEGAFYEDYKVIPILVFDAILIGEFITAEEIISENLIEIATETLCSICSKRINCMHAKNISFVWDCEQYKKEPQ